MLIGPFTQLLTLRDLPLAGPIADRSLEVIPDAGIRVDKGLITAIDGYSQLKKMYPEDSLSIIESPTVAVPAFIDSHTHICFEGSRHRDYSLRLSGSSYQEIAEQGGGILSTVKWTREASLEQLVKGIVRRCQRLIAGGVATCEVKSGYGLSVDAELKMLEAIQEANSQVAPSLISTCLSAHTCPKEAESPQAYLEMTLNDLLPVIKQKKLSKRVDIFIEKGAFSIEEARHYLLSAKKQGFSLTVHADQFSLGGSKLAAEVGAISADHLEQSGIEEIKALCAAGVVATALPGASLGLGEPFTKARLILDNGGILAIASDWNPGSAPMGDLLTQAALLSVAEKLSAAETFAGLTFRSAHALGLKDRGQVKEAYRADIACFPCEDYREILYQQGSLRPSQLFIEGVEAK
jgi:imidazolonepropionase